MLPSLVQQVVQLKTNRDGFTQRSVHYRALEEPSDIFSTENLFSSILESSFGIWFVDNLKIINKNLDCGDFKKMNKCAQNYFIKRQSVDTKSAFT